MWLRSPIDCVHGAFDYLNPYTEPTLPSNKEQHLHELYIDGGSGCLVEDDEDLEADPDPDPDLQVVEETPEEAGKCWDQILF